MEIEKNKNGRPTSMTPEVVSKLEAAFSNGCNVVEACLFADISRETYYKYCNENEDFSDRMKDMRSRPDMTARINVVRSIRAGNIDDSKWWLERKKKDEFSIRSENHTLLGTTNIKTIEGESHENLMETYAALVRGKMNINEINFSDSNGKLPIIDAIVEPVETKLSEDSATKNGDDAAP